MLPRREYGLLRKKLSRHFETIPKKEAPPDKQDGAEKSCLVIQAFRSRTLTVAVNHTLLDLPDLIRSAVIAPDNDTDASL
jgi:hypothetical protein